MSELQRIALLSAGKRDWKRKEKRSLGNTPEGTTVYFKHLRHSSLLASNTESTWGVTP